VKRIDKLPETEDEKHIKNITAHQGRREGNPCVRACVQAHINMHACMLPTGMVNNICMSDEYEYDWVEWVTYTEAKIFGLMATIHQKDFCDGKKSLEMFGGPRPPIFLKT
jgi:hypothetical protein